MPNSTPDVRLDDLISAIASAHAAPLDRLERAVAVAAHLDEVADHLIGHFVDQARRSGASWTEIGGSMGVSKQAVQKRFSSKPASGLDASQGFSRFTDEARRAVVSAQDEAKRAGNDRITVGHLVLGLVADEGCAAVRMIAAQGVELEVVRSTARATLPGQATSVPEFVPFDQHARDALERSFEEAGRRGHEAVGTEHVLLAVLAVEDGTGVLAGLGVHAGKLDDAPGEQPH